MTTLYHRTSDGHTQVVSYNYQTYDLARSHVARWLIERRITRFECRSLWLMMERQHRKDTQHCKGK